MEELFTYFKDLGLSEPDTLAILSTFQPKILEKGDHFIQENQFCKQLAFVESGLFQYYLLSDGMERTTYIGWGSIIISDIRLHDFRFPIGCWNSDLLVQFE